MRVVKQGVEHGYITQSESSWENRQESDRYDYRFASEFPDYGSGGLNYNWRGFTTEPNFDAAPYPKVPWNVMADGTMISKPHVEQIGYSDSYSYTVPQTGLESKVLGRGGTNEPTVYDGASYKVRYLGLGKLDDPEIPAKDPRFDEAAKYIFGSGHPEFWEWSYDPDYPQNEGSTGSVDDSITRRETHTKVTKDGTYSTYTVDSSRSVSVCLRLIAIPDEYRAVIEVEGKEYDYSGDCYDLGTLIAPSFDVKVSREGADSISDFSATFGDSQFYSVPTVENGGTVTVDLSSVWADMASGETHTVIVNAETGARKSYDTVVKFTKKDGSIALESKPVDHETRPKKCTILSSLVLPELATVEWQVCNNANDVTPSWEVYTGPGYEFLNATKTAEKWAVAWKVRIDGTKASTKSEIIKQVAMAVI